MKHTTGILSKQVTGSNGYDYLCVTIVESAIKDWRKGKYSKYYFDAIDWLESRDSCLWCDYLGLDRSYLLNKLRELS